MCAVVKEGCYKFAEIAKFDQSVTMSPRRGDYFTDKLKKSPPFKVN